ncbi:hypothetical protein ACFQVD_37980 [Streptosporangium amethystogenes subsp. fukuiense]|uniref:Uncharacterized protein n=1 Tax=Streptosporangium amethystogenes subsp. fukuiense TaxID=698418 RepID=A0ABW2TCD0_9ACTN
MSSAMLVLGVSALPGGFFARAEPSPAGVTGPAVWVIAPITPARPSIAPGGPGTYAEPD